MIYGNIDLNDVFGRGFARGGGGRGGGGFVPRRPFRPQRGSSSSSSQSSSSSGDWGYRVAATDGASTGGGVDVEAIANQVASELVNLTGMSSPPVSFGGEEDGEPQFGAIVPTAALPNAAQNRLAQARYVERMREDVRGRSAYLQEMENPPETETWFDPNPTVIERESIAVTETPRYGARYGFACSVPKKTERMGALDVQTDVTRPSRVPPEFFGGVPAPMVPSHSYGGVPAPMVPSHSYGGVPAPMVPSHSYGQLPAPMVPAHYGEDTWRPASPFMDALKIGVGVGLGVTAVVVGVNLLGRAMR